MSEVVASRAPRWSRRGSVREINKVQCYLALETKVKEKRFLLSYIISIQLAPSVNIVNPLTDI